MILKIVNGLYVDKQTRAWCLLKYPGHSKGCPNYNKKSICPPTVGMMEDYFNIYKPLWFILEPFNLAEHAARLKAKHPGWSDRQCRCCLYWQGTVRKNLKVRTKIFLYEHPGTIVTDCPEAMGVDVFKTCLNHSIELEKNPIANVYKISMVGYPPA